MLKKLLLTSIIFALIMSLFDCSPKTQIPTTVFATTTVTQQMSTTTATISTSISKTITTQTTTPSVSSTNTPGTTVVLPFDGIIQTANDTGNKYIFTISNVTRKPSTRSGWDDLKIEYNYLVMPDNKLQKTTIGTSIYIIWDGGGKVQLAYWDPQNHDYTLQVPSVATNVQFQFLTNEYIGCTLNKNILSLQPINANLYRTWLNDVMHRVTPDKQITEAKILNYFLPIKNLNVKVSNLQTADSEFAFDLDMTNATTTQDITVKDIRFAPLFLYDIDGRQVSLTNNYADNFGVTVSCGIIPPGQTKRITIKVDVTRMRESTGQYLSLPKETKYMACTFTSSFGGLYATYAEEIISSWPIFLNGPFTSAIRSEIPARAPLIVNFKGWMTNVNGQQQTITTKKIGDIYPVVGYVEIQNPQEYAYFLEVWRAVIQGDDTMLNQEYFRLDVSHQPFSLVIPSKYENVTGEANTKGYYLKVKGVNIDMSVNQVWVMEDAYPPRFMFTK